MPLHAESILPSLLDRLTDDEPDVLVETNYERFLTPEEYAQTVVRDLESLLNTRAPSANALLGEGTAGRQLKDFPEICRSVLLYGIPDICGLIQAALSPAHIAGLLKKAIENFEPRVDAKKLQVRPIPPGEIKTAIQNPSIMYFEIRGWLIMDPAPEELKLRTAVDFDSGKCLFADGRKAV